MDIIINHNTQTPIYLQIVNQLKEVILKGEITNGFMLPSERAMAKLLNALDYLAALLIKPGDVVITIVSRKINKRSISFLKIRNK
jgi:hypothetical protein